MDLFCCIPLSIVMIVFVCCCYCCFKLFFCRICFLQISSFCACVCGFFFFFSCFRRLQDIWQFSAVYFWLNSGLKSWLGALDLWEGVVFSVTWVDFGGEGRVPTSTWMSWFGQILQSRGFQSPSWMVRICPAVLWEPHGGRRIEFLARCVYGANLSICPSPPTLFWLATHTVPEV